MKTKIFFLTLLIHFTAWAGGSVIGNGAGLVENNFQFAYQNLLTTFSECITLAKCELTEAETDIVRNMRKVIELNRSNENRLVFLSEKDHPGFFNTGLGEEHRIAKTGLDADTPIYVNLDLLYTADGKPAFDYATITSVLVHELGHQTGETNHAKLDIIGAKIKKTILKNTQNHIVQLNEEQIEVSVINRQFPFRTSDLVIAWQNVGAITGTQPILEKVKCNNSQESLAGLELLNGHYTYLKKPTPEKAAHFGFGFWAVLTCYSDEKESFHQEQKQIEIEVTRELELTILSVQEL